MTGGFVGMALSVMDAGAAFGGEAVVAFGELRVEQFAVNVAADLLEAGCGVGGGAAIDVWPCRSTDT